ncbi:hypothetical protein Pla52n_27020 [Stieleria varia]|uniref:Uncharacterized protein n=1 Tax=Stieleria varia TaxID=2528005 RepID=A0A5C6AY36_9BACT|nr:hypothetical protein Pla52n_27020 [Stieleria varia]
MIGYALGATIESIQLGGEADEWLPERFGDCRINWGRVDASSDWQRQREILTILAGPAAEMLYCGENLHPAAFAPWQHDWQLAWQISKSLVRDPIGRTHALESCVLWLHNRLGTQPCWAAVAAVADELLAHEYLDQEQLADTLSFWI